MARRARSGRRGGARRARVETSAGGVVVRRAGGEPRFLLIRDPYGNWGLPKGHMEPAETPEQAALREVREETGLSDLRVLGPLGVTDWYFRADGERVHKFCHFFLMESACGEARPQTEEGISEVVWLPLEDAVRTVTYENVREVLRAAAQRLGAGGRGGGAF